MSAIDQLKLAEAIRKHLLTCPFFPVKGGLFGIDTLSIDGESMALTMDVGKIIKTFIDGTRVISQPFTLIYRSTLTENDMEKSSMIGVLNQIGEWMQGDGLPDFMPKFKVRNLEQVSMASNYIEDEKFIGYGATYVLEYETT
jgi:hypothetical protein